MQQQALETLLYVLLKRTGVLNNERALRSLIRECEKLGITGDKIREISDYIQSDDHATFLTVRRHAARAQNRARKISS